MHREIPHALKEISKKAALFEKKRAKKLLPIMAPERPQYGPSNAVMSKSFLVTFFQKSNGFPTPQATNS
jgi:hypothetical protein